MELGQVAAHLKTTWGVVPKTSPRTIFAVTGHGALGKSLFASWFVRELGWSHVGIDQFAYDRSARSAAGLSGYNPASFDLDGYLTALAQLREGQPAYIPRYSHSSGVSCRLPECAVHEHWVHGQAPVITEGAFMWMPKVRQHIASAVYFGYGCGEAYWQWRYSNDVTRRNYNASVARTHVRHLRRDAAFWITRSLPYCDYRASVQLPNFSYHLERRKADSL